MQVLHSTGHSGKQMHEFTHSHEQPPWTSKIVMARREFHKFFHGKRTEITCDGAASILRIAKREQFGTAQDHSPVCQ